MIVDRNMGSSQFTHTSHGARQDRLPLGDHLGPPIRQPDVNARIIVSGTFRPPFWPSYYGGPVHMRLIESMTLSAGSKF